MGQVSFNKDGDRLLDLVIRQYDADVGGLWIFCIVANSEFVEHLYYSTNIK